MKKNRFAALLLTGKAASLPALISQARAADISPTYQDVLGTSGDDLRVIELPVTGFKLQSVALDSNYGSNSYASILCNNMLATTNPDLNFVVTGVVQGETVYFAAASNKNDATNTAMDARLTIGNQWLKMLGSVATASAAAGSTPARISVNFSVPAATMQSLVSGGRVYVQAVTMTSSTASTPTSWRYSELDEIRVGNCSVTAYGTTIY